jgi:hypothetical protein
MCPQAELLVLRGLRPRADERRPRAGRQGASRRQRRRRLIASCCGVRALVSRARSRVTSGVETPFCGTGDVLPIFHLLR